MIDGRDIFSRLIHFIEVVPQAFPPRASKSWSPTFTSFFYVLGRQQGYEPRCGDCHKKMGDVCSERRLRAFSGDYAEATRPWKVHGLLDIDVAWVPPRFSIPKDFVDVPVPERAEIHLAYEHEDEGTMYTDKRGTRLNVVLDEVRKVGNVRSSTKVFSYVSSESEIQGDEHIQQIRAEIARIPLTEHLTKEWVIIGLGKYKAPRSGKATIMLNSQRQLACKAVGLDCNGAVVWREMRMVRYPL